MDMRPPVFPTPKRSRGDGAQRDRRRPSRAAARRTPTPRPRPSTSGSRRFRMQGRAVSRDRSSKASCPTHRQMPGDARRLAQRRSRLCEGSAIPAPRSLPRSRFRRRADRPAGHPQKPRASIAVGASICSNCLVATTGPAQRSSTSTSISWASSVCTRHSVTVIEQAKAVRVRRIGWLHVHLATTTIPLRPTPKSCRTKNVALARAFLFNALRSSKKPRRQGRARHDRQRLKLRSDRYAKALRRLKIKHICAPGPTRPERDVKAGSASSRLSLREWATP